MFYELIFIIEDGKFTSFFIMKLSAGILAGRHCFKPGFLTAIKYQRLFL